MLPNTQTDVEVLNALTGRIMRIEDITLGAGPAIRTAGPHDNFIVRYRGKIYNEDTSQAYDQLTELLKPYNITPLFRWDAGRHAVVLVPGLPRPNPSNPTVNLVLFILTLFSVLLAGGLYGAVQDPFANGVTLQSILQLLASGWPFAVSLLLILGCHEFGHYLAGRFHGVHVTLPYFIPFPFSLFGTMGAFINMKEPPRNRRALLDIAIAGPLAGLVVAIPVLLVGLSLSHLTTLPFSIPRGASLGMEGNSILYLMLKGLVFGKALPQPVNFGSLPPLIYWVGYFFTGRPLPLGGTDVMLHPVAWAGWAGILVTSLNLIPAGQLDGGHILFTLLGAKLSRAILPFILVVLVALGFVWNGWWLWAGLVFLIGRGYAEPLDLITPLNSGRRALALVGILAFILVFTPVPLL